MDFVRMIRYITSSFLAMSKFSRVRFCLKYHYSCFFVLFCLFVFSHFFKLLLFSGSLCCLLFLVTVRVFANGPGDLGSIPGRVIPKTQKMVLDASLINTQHYKVRIKGKVEQSREGVAPSPTPWCSSYRKWSLRVTLDYGRQLYFTLLLFI